MAFAEGNGKGGGTSSTERAMDSPCQIGTRRAYRDPRRVDPRNLFAVARKRRPVGAGWGYCGVDFARRRRGLLRVHPVVWALAETPERPQTGAPRPGSNPSRP